LSWKRSGRLISQSGRKDYRLDAETLARLAWIDPRLLRPIGTAAKRRSCT